MGLGDELYGSACYDAEDIREWREMSERNPDEIGALWLKTGSKGEYMTGTINGQAVVVFRNDRKQGNQPDWRVLKAKPRE